MIQRHDSGRPSGVLALIAVAVALAAACGIAPIAAAGGHAFAAKTLNGNDNAHLRWLRTSGETLVEEGPVSGGITGTMHATLHLGATFTGTFTLDTPYGKIIGHGTATPHGSGRYESFSGTNVIVGGTGRYVHAHGHGSMYGTFDRKTYAITIQTRGTLYY